MPSEKHTVFISYSRADSDLVTVAANLLRAGGAKVFMDVRDIDYGDDWKAVLIAKIHEVERVLVFWSKKAAISEWVKREWELALELGKRLVPVPLDETPLPDGLARFNALTELVPALQAAIERLQGQRQAPAAKKSRGLGLEGVIGYVVGKVTDLFKPSGTLSHGPPARIPWEKVLLPKSRKPAAPEIPVEFARYVTDLVFQD